MSNKTFKKIYRRLAQVILPPIAALLIKFIMLTSRVEIIGADSFYRLLDSGEGFIIPFWHGRMFLFPAFYKKYVDRDLRVLISAHRDGELISRIIDRFDLGTVRGSSRRGGKAAMLELQNLVKRGVVVIVTPDGPKGPGLKVRRGIIEMAKRTGAPILPVTYSATRKIILDTWDKFVVPLPFSTVTFSFGEPIYVGHDISREQGAEIRDRLENELNQISARADRGW